VPIGFGRREGAHQHHSPATEKRGKDFVFLGGELGHGRRGEGLSLFLPLSKEKTLRGKVATNSLTVEGGEKGKEVFL